MTDPTLAALTGRALHETRSVGGPWYPCGGDYGHPDCECESMALHWLANPAMADLARKAAAWDEMRPLLVRWWFRQWTHDAPPLDEPDDEDLAAALEQGE